MIVILEHLLRSNTQTYSHLKALYIKAYIRKIVQVLIDVILCFYIGLYAYAIIVHIQANQLLPQLLMEQFDTFPIQCRHIEHMHEGVRSIV